MSWQPYSAQSFVANASLCQKEAARISSERRGMRDLSCAALPVEQRVTAAKRAHDAAAPDCQAAAAASAGCWPRCLQRFAGPREPPWTGYMAGFGRALALHPGHHGSCKHSFSQVLAWSLSIHQVVRQL